MTTSVNVLVFPNGLRVRYDVELLDHAMKVTVPALGRSFRAEGKDGGFAAQATAWQRMRDFFDIATAIDDEFVTQVVSWHPPTSKGVFIGGREAE